MTSLHFTAVALTLIAILFEFIVSENGRESAYIHTFMYVYIYVCKFGIIAELQLKLMLECQYQLTARNA